MQSGPKAESLQLQSDSSEMLMILLMLQSTQCGTPLMLPGVSCSLLVVYVPDCPLKGVDELLRQHRPRPRSFSFTSCSKVSSGAKATKHSDGIFVMGG